MDKAAWFEIIKDDLIEWLQNYEGERFHAILADPPYALISVTKRFGKENSAPAQEGADGRFSRLSGGFMGQTWDGFASLDHYREWVKTWAKLLIEKALYPGAVCLFFGGTRTWHHLAVGLEAGGFEVYDTLLWLYGSGFPKSHDISKGIDKAAGVENDRPVIGIERMKKISSPKGQPSSGYALRQEQILYEHTSAASEQGKTWQGYGTALKPAWEPIIVCRAPRNGATFARLALEHGSGALNIDGSRIGMTREDADNINSKHAGMDVDNYDRKPGVSLELSVTPMPLIKAEAHKLGRWPANLLLSHHEDCQKIGTFEVPARVINRWLDGMKPFGDGAGGKYETVHPTRQGEASAERTYDDEGGTNFAMKPGPRRDKDMETVERWACVPECPIRQLDDQGLLRGVHSAGSYKPPGGWQSEGGWGFIGESEYGGARIGDKGGPSRFFYCGKANRSEKDKGLENFYWKRTGKGFERVDQETWAKLERRKRAKGCIHPTVKPLNICRYLATLILPPQQDDRIRRILIPFSGSGSEIIAAKQAGWDLIIGIETSSIYNDIARARINANIGMF